MPDLTAFHDIAARVNNRGRWGAEDEIGTLNLITDEVVRAAAATVRTGRRAGLALPLKHRGVQTGLVAGRVNPLHTMVALNWELFGPGSGKTEFINGSPIISPQAPIASAFRRYRLSRSPSRHSSGSSWPLSIDDSPHRNPKGRSVGEMIAENTRRHRTRWGRTPAPLRRTWSARDEAKLLRVGSGPADVATRPCDETIQ